jgi:hypothetical protein
MLFRAKKKLLKRLYKPTSDVTESSYLASGFDRETSPITNLFNNSKLFMTIRPTLSHTS